MELCRIACFIFFFLYFCSYAIVAGNSLYHAKQRIFKVSGYCCSYEVAAEQKARTTYDNILRLVKDPDICDPIKFLRAREIVHYQRFGEAKSSYTSKIEKRNVYRNIDNKSPYTKVSIKYSIQFQSHPHQYISLL